MLLRSSSTPILGSLLADSHHHQPEIVTPTHQFKKFLHTQVGSHRFSCNSSPNSPEISGMQLQSKGFRKVLSEGNLEGLAVHDPSNVDDEFTLALPIKKFSRINGLETIPSFSFRSSRGCCYEEEEEEEEEENESSKVEMRLKVAAGREMCLVRGNGVAERESDCGGGGGGGGHRPVDYYRGGGDGHGFSIEEHYKKMLEENPSNPLFLRNYAQFLYQTKGDLKGAEEYYSRAILADPSDGEVLSQYAKLVWELHHDAERATSYFQCAVQAASEDSHVHAAFAKFLWDTEDNEDEDDEPSKAHKLTVIHSEQQLPSAAAR